MVSIGEGDGNAAVMAKGRIVDIGNCKLISDVCSTSWETRAPTRKLLFTVGKALELCLREEGMKIGNMESFACLVSTEGTMTRKQTS